MIQSHVYARFDDTRIFSIPAEEGEAVCTVKKGDWLGVIVQHGDWVHVVGVECEGWVKVGDTEPRPPFQLHILVPENGVISYVNDPTFEGMKSL